MKKKNVLILLSLFPTLLSMDKVPSSSSSSSFSFSYTTKMTDTVCYYQVNSQFADVQIESDIYFQSERVVRTGRDLFCSNLSTRVDIPKSRIQSLMDQIGKDYSFLAKRPFYYSDDLSGAISKIHVDGKENPFGIYAFFAFQQTKLYEFECTYHAGNKKITFLACTFDTSYVLNTVNYFKTMEEYERFMKSKEVLV